MSLANPPHRTETSEQNSIPTPKTHRTKAYLRFYYVRTILISAIQPIPSSTPQAINPNFPAKLLHVAVPFHGASSPANVTARPNPHRVHRKDQTTVARSLRNSSTRANCSRTQLRIISDQPRLHIQRLNTRQSGQISWEARFDSAGLREFSQRETSIVPRAKVCYSGRRGRSRGNCL